MIETTVFIGNGFDLSLGLKTRYTDFFNNKDFWPVCETVSDQDQLYKRLNGEYTGTESENKLGAEATWFDLEDELKKHAKRSLEKQFLLGSGYEEAFLRDEEYFNRLSEGLRRYLEHEEERWRKQYKCAHSTAAYRLMWQICANANLDPNIVTFNYTHVKTLVEAGNRPYEPKRVRLNPDKIQHVHGSLSEEHIILGINEDKEVRKEYDFLFKSWDEMYSSHNVIDTLTNSQIIFFFGISFGSIDSVYFVDFFKAIMEGRYVGEKKHIVICTYNEKSLREIRRQFFKMDISIMKLKAYCDLNFLLTTPDHPNSSLKFDENKLLRWLSEWTNS